jgi:hypothetical protein
MDRSRGDGPLGPARDEQPAIWTSFGSFPGQPGNGFIARDLVTLFGPYGRYGKSRKMVACNRARGFPTSGLRVRLAAPCSREQNLQEWP